MPRGRAGHTPWADFPKGLESTTGGAWEQLRWQLTQGLLEEGAAWPQKQLWLWSRQRLHMEGAAWPKITIPAVQAPERWALGDTTEDLALPSEKAEARRTQGNKDAPAAR